MGAARLGSSESGSLATHLLSQSPLYVLRSSLDMRENVSRRNFLRGGALVAAGATMPRSSLALAPSQETGRPCPIQLGIATYTFRAFPREKMIGSLKQLGINQIN